MCISESRMKIGSKLCSILQHLNQLVRYYLSFETNMHLYTYHLLLTREHFLYDPLNLVK